MKRKCGSVILGLMLLMPMSVNALETPVTLTQGANVIDVTVPVSMPIHVDNKGVVTTSDKTNITNNSFAPVEITNIKVTPKDGWSLQDFEKNYHSCKLGTKEFGLKIDGENVNTDGTVKGTNRVINGNSSFNLTYGAKVSPQIKEVKNSNIADVVLTIGWKMDSSKQNESEGFSATSDGFSATLYGTTETYQPRVEIPNLNNLNN